MRKEEFKTRMNELSQKINDLGNKTKDSLDTAKIQGMYAKDKINEIASETKGNINALKDNLKLFSDKVRGKASSELLKAQMNIDIAKKELAAKKEAHDKEQLEKYIDESVEYASACVELSLLAAEEAKLAMLEAIEASKEYEEKYGSNE